MAFFNLPIVINLFDCHACIYSNQVNVICGHISTPNYNYLKGGSSC